MPRNIVQLEVVESHTHTRSHTHTHTHTHTHAHAHKHTHTHTHTHNVTRDVETVVARRAGGMIGL